MFYAVLFQFLCDSLGCTLPCFVAVQAQVHLFEPGLVLQQLPKDLIGNRTGCRIAVILPAGLVDILYVLECSLPSLVVKVDPILVTAEDRAGELFLVVVKAFVHIFLHSDGASRQFISTL